MVPWNDQIHPDVEELVDADPRHEVKAKALPVQVFSTYVKIPFETGYTPAARAFGKDRPGRDVSNSKHAALPVRSPIGQHRRNLVPDGSREKFPGTGAR